MNSGKNADAGHSICIGHRSLPWVLQSFAVAVYGMISNPTRQTHRDHFHLRRSVLSIQAIEFWSYRNHLVEILASDHPGNHGNGGKLLPKL